MLPVVVFGEIDLVLHLQAELRQGEEREEGGYQHGHIKMWVVAEVERREIKGKQPFDEKPRQIDALNTEEATGEHDNQEGEKHTWDFS